MELIFSNVPITVKEFVADYDRKYKFILLEESYKCIGKFEKNELLLIPNEHSERLVGGYAYVKQSKNTIILTLRA